MMSWPVLLRHGPLRPYCHSELPSKGETAVVAEEPSTAKEVYLARIYFEAGEYSPY